MIKLNISYHFLQVQTIGPEGSKVFWIFLILAVAVAIASFFLLKRKINIKLPNFSSSLSVQLKKNKIYHPTTINLKITNKRKKAVVIENPVLRFKRGRSTKAFKIKNVNSSKVYPLYLEPNKTHELPVALKAFYDYDEKLKRYSRLRVEFQFDKDQFKSSSYLLLVSTLFRKVKL